MALPPKSLGTGRHVMAAPILDQGGEVAYMATGHQFDLPYSVELWDEGDTRVEELIALTGDYNVARAAYQEAVKRRPGRIPRRATDQQPLTPHSR